MEERVIDRYVIDTHPTPVQLPPAEDYPEEHLPTDEEEEPEVEEPVIMAASAPSPRQQEPVELVQPVEEEPEVLISSSWSAPSEAVGSNDEVLEQEFTAALQSDDQFDDGNTFSPELLSRSLEQQKTGTFLTLFQNL